jgi:transposase
VIVIEPEGDLTGLKKIGEEITETLAYRPARLVVLRRVRPKYVDPRNEERGVIIATLPARAIEKGMAEPSLLAHVVIEKYVDHRVSGNVHARWGKAPRSRSAETGCKPP